MTNYTTGPHRAIANKTSWGVYDRDGRAIAILSKDIFGAKMTAANAELFAAASEMLTALERVVNRAAPSGTDSTGQDMVQFRRAMLEECRAVIAKVKGEA